VSHAVRSSLLRGARFRLGGYAGCLVLVATLPPSAGCGAEPSAPQKADAGQLGGSFAAAADGGGAGTNGEVDAAGISGASAVGGAGGSGAVHAGHGGTAAQGGQAGQGGASGSGYAGPSQTYATSFDRTESPVSEAGRWTQHGLASGADWTNVQTGNGLAYGTQTGAGGYDDSIALLSGFGTDYRLTAVVHLAGQRSESTNTHEVELILRGSYSPHVQHLYECNLGYAGASGWYAQIMRMDGAFGAFTEIGSAVTQVPEVHDGSIFVAEIRGSEIDSYVDGVKVQTAVDHTYVSGAPGIGFFWRGSERLDDFAFTSLTVLGL
jgi:hypothetical protein